MRIRAPDPRVLMATLVVISALVLTGCPLVRDNAFLTLPVPNPATDCQVRFTTGNVESDSMLSPVTGSLVANIATIIGARNCPEGMLMTVPRHVPITGFDALREETRREVLEGRDAE